MKSLRSEHKFDGEHINRDISNANRIAVHARSLRNRLAQILSPTVALMMVNAWCSAAHADPSFVQDGRAGFVVSFIEFALGPDASESGACPDGMTQGPQRTAGPTGAAAARQNGEGATGGEASQQEAERRFIANLMDPKRPDPCAHPEAIGPDAGFKTIKTSNLKVQGMDLDGQVSSAKGKAAPGTCAHDDFNGVHGEKGIDNQLYRVVGCSNSFQSTGQSNTFTIEMHTGSWGILITLDGVDDIRNDDDVRVGFYANADPIELSPAREPLRDATYAIEQDARFQATTRGRIKDGVLTTDPVDLRIHKITNGIYLERPLKRARARMTLSDDGVLEGYLSGYTPVDELYDYQYAFRNGKNATGAPADPRLIKISSLGQAAVVGHTCNGAYYALHENADGDPDPKTGKCTSISTQYHIKAIPAFVVNTATKSVNDDLERRAK